MTTSTTPESGNAPKKRRLRGSCDSCAHRKVKCDAALVGIGASCTNCVTFNTRCTKDRGGRHDEFASARSLVASISRAKTYAPPSEQSIQRKHVLDLVAYAQHLERSYSILKNTIPAGPTSHSHSPADSLVDYENEEVNLSVDLHHREFHDPEEDAALDVKTNLLAGDPSGRPRFFGPLSNISLVKSAFEELNIGASPYLTKESENPFRRPKYWLPTHWSHSFFSDEPRQHEFPPQDLLNSLVDLFFIYIAPYMPVLCQHSFLKSISGGLHHQNPRFGDLVLAVCALSSRHSTDPRTSSPGLDHCAGWKYFSQIRLSPNFAVPVSLHELQTASICICYLFDAPPPLGTFSWPILGLAIRLAQDIGLHRSREPATPSNEPWRRAFWTLIVIDIILSAAHGRPRATSPTDYDVAPIAEIDDNYWNTFKQPEGKPSIMAYYNQFIKLLHILSFAQRTLFSVKKPAKGDLKVWTSDILRQLNTELTKWKTELPEHLNWNPDQQDPVFFNQGAYLQAIHSWIVIIIYRPFIPLRPQNLPFSLSALAESVTAARVCTTALHTLHERNIPMPLPQFPMALLGSGVVLVLQIRMGRQRGIATDINLDTQHVEKIMKIFKSSEDRFPSCGRFHDILDEMLHFDRSPEKPTTASVATPPNKRRMDSQTDAPFPTTRFPSSPVASGGPESSNDSLFSFAQPDPSSVTTSVWDSMSSVPDHAGNLQDISNPNWDFASVMDDGISDWDNIVAGRLAIPQPSSMPAYYGGDIIPNLGTQTRSSNLDHHPTEHLPFPSSSIY